MNKKDKKFLINLNLNNRNYLVTLSSIISNWTFSLTIFILAIIALIFSILRINKFTMIISMLLMLFILIAWIKGWREVKKNIKFSIEFNKQYQKYYKELYPRLKGKYF